MEAGPDPDRTLHWDGLVNGRDLAGLIIANGAPIVPRRLVRSASPHLLTAAGWRQLADAGITTIVDVRHWWEIEREAIGPGLVPATVTRIEVPLEPPDYIERWAERPDRWRLTTPHYYREFLAEHRDRVATVIEAIAGARPGGVLVHCSAGRDRAGLVVAMALDLVGVGHDRIVADHWLSYDRPEPIEVALGRPLRERPTLTVEDHRSVMMETLAAVPARSCFPAPARADRAAAALVDRLC